MRHDPSVPHLPHVAAAATIVTLALAVAGCGGDTEERGTATTGASAAAGAAPSAPASRPTARSSVPAVPSDPDPDPNSDPNSATPPDLVAETDPPPASWTATCPTSTKSPLGCRAVRGRVLAIQSYDPDGDGDLHVIAVGGDVTAPGITVFDVRTPLRPKRDPVKGEFVTGAGPVFRGSLKQRQIQVDEFRVWRPGD